MSTSDDTPQRPPARDVAWWRAEKSTIEAMELWAAQPTIVPEDVIARVEGLRKLQHVLHKHLTAFYSRSFSIFCRVHVSAFLSGQGAVRPEDPRDQMHFADREAWDDFMHAARLWFLLEVTLARIQSDADRSILNGGDWVADVAGDLALYARELPNLFLGEVYLFQDEANRAQAALGLGALAESGIHLYGDLGSAVAEQGPVPAGVPGEYAWPGDLLSYIAPSAAWQVGRTTESWETLAADVANLIKREGRPQSRAGIYVLSSPDDAAEGLSGPGGLESLLGQDEDRLASLLDSAPLSKQERQVADLRARDHSFKEISDILGIKEPSARVVFRNALIKLRESRSET